MTTQEVKDALGLQFDFELAEFFGIGKAAVSNWEGEVPDSRVWQLRALRPDLFPVPDDRAA